MIGDNGVLTQSQQASIKTNKASEFETVQLSVAGSFDDEGNLDLETLVANLTNEVAEPKKIETAKEENQDAFPVTVTAKYGKYEIDNNGEISKKVSNIVIEDISILDVNGNVIESKIQEGQEKAYIHFYASLLNSNDLTVSSVGLNPIFERGECITEINSNGEYIFNITGTADGEMVSLDKSINVNVFSNLPNGLEIGSNVTYRPTGKYDWSTQYSSDSSSTLKLQTIATGTVEQGYTDFSITDWKVLSINEDTENVQIVPDISNNNTAVNLFGAQGYNNGVILLNDACASLYSMGDNITARSINLEDIESIMNKNGIDANNDGILDWIAARDSSKNGDTIYGDRKTSSYSYYNTNANFPTIYELEIRSVINGVERNSGLELSEQKYYVHPGYTHGYKSNGNKGYINPYETMYYFSEYSEKKLSDFLGVKYSEILLPNLNKNYWVASRCISNTFDSCYFYIRCVYKYGLSGKSLFDSKANENGETNCLFPIVSVNFNCIRKNSNNEFIVEDFLDN